MREVSVSAEGGGTLPSAEPDDNRGSGVGVWVRLHFVVVLFGVTIALYLLSVWLHLPNSGGHIYSDIVTVYQSRECDSSGCNIGVPYLQTFVEYPVITSMFMYLMGILGGLFSGALINNYYYFTALFLAIPTLLSVRELVKICEIRGVAKERLLWYFVVTPTFVYMVLLNWYIIGVFFAILGMRLYTQGRTVSSGVVLGLSAASNFVTAVPALGLLLASKTNRARVSFLAAGLGAYALVNVPFLAVNPRLWFMSFNWTYNWYTENSWILILSPDLYSPLRHAVPPIAFAVAVVGILWLRYRRGVSDPIVLAFLSMFAYVFSTYIYPPQLNLTLLPFFILLPIAGYLEFMVFDIANASIIVLGFSQALLPLGISYSFNAFARFSLLWWIEVVRSLWVGKVALLNRVTNRAWTSILQRLPGTGLPKSPVPSVQRPVEDSKPRSGAQEL